MARYFVRETSGRSDGTLKTRWKEYGATAALGYLLLVHFTDLKPKQLSKKRFVERLFEQAEDGETLRRFFASYLGLARRLRPRGYQFEELQLDGLDGEAPDLTVSPFSERDKQLIENYQS